MDDPVTLFLCGDVMLGRGIDQVLAHPSEPTLYEAAVTDARDYVRLAERAHGPIGRLSCREMWGEALAQLEQRRPHARLINLETSVTTRSVPEPKGINYRMHPGNVGCIGVAGIDGCVLANNHVLDWGRDGLLETLQVLEAAGLRCAGAGRDLDAALTPAVLELGWGQRLRLHAFALPSSGVPPSWAAASQRPGVAFLPDLSEASRQAVEACISLGWRSGDVTVVSLHWGGNWGHVVPEGQRRFARGLIDGGRVDVVYGHSSHHAKAIEVYRGKPILYGCGDFINDYEGIAGKEEYRADLPVMYFASLRRSTRTLAGLQLVPLKLARFRLQPAAAADVAWLAATLCRECAVFGTSIRRCSNRALELCW